MDYFSRETFFLEIETVSNSGFFLNRPTSCCKVPVSRQQDRDKYAPQNIGGTQMSHIGLKCRLEVEHSD